MIIGNITKVRIKFPQVTMCYSLFPYSHDQAKVYFLIIHIKICIQVASKVAT